MAGRRLASRGPRNSWEPRLTPALIDPPAFCAGQWEQSERSAEDSLIERAGRSFSHVLTHHAVMNARHLSLRALLKTPSAESGSHHTHTRSRTLPSPLIAAWATTFDIPHQRTSTLTPADVQTQEWARKKKTKKKPHRHTHRCAAQQSEHFQHVLEARFNFLPLCSCGKRTTSPKDSKKSQIIQGVFLRLKTG